MFDLIFLLELGTSIAVAFLGSEYLATQRLDAVYASFSLGGSVLLLLLTRVWGVTTLVVGFDLLSLIPPILFVAFFVAFLFWAVLAYSSKASFIVSLLLPLYAFSAVLIAFHSYELHPEIAKFCTSTAVFLAIMWHQRPKKRASSLREFGKLLIRALLPMLVFFPLFLIGVAVFFLVFSSVSDYLNVSHSIVNPLIFYGIFYSPNCALFVFYSKVKRKQSGFVWIV